MKKIISKFLIRRGFNKLVKEIQVLNDKKMNAEEAINFLFSKKAELICPWQYKEEILQLATEIEKLKPEVTMEIGTANGGTLFMTSRLADEKSLLISLDLPGGAFGGGYPEWKVPIYKSFAKKNQRIELLREDSHSENALKKIKEILGGKQIDYLFIDGDHTYEGAKQDFETYSKMVRPGGLIAFHDIVIHKGSRCDAYRLWEEVKKSYNYKEFVNDWNQNQFGIGLIEYR
jgi:predicted O-methyltransferase YrrM